MRLRAYIRLFRLTAVLAHGVNAEQFNGYYDNTDVYNKVAGMLGVQ